MNPDNGFLYLPSSETQKLKRYYRMLITECHLQNLYDPEDILNQVFEKAQNMIDSGRTIHSPYGWYRKVGERIILSAHRQEISKKKACQHLQNQWQKSGSNLCPGEPYEHPNVPVLQTSLEELKQVSPKDYQLVWLHFFQGLSWEKVAARLHPETPIDKKLVNRVRRAGWRAKEKLKRMTFKKLQGETD